MRKDPRKRYSTTPAFAWEDGAPVLFRGLMPREVLPKPAFVEHVLRVGDRLDKLADEFYGDPRLWWVIAQANPGVFAPADLIYGPPDPDDALAQFRAGATIGIPAKPGDAT